MTNKLRRLYWDSNVFLSHLNSHPDRAEIIVDVIREIQDHADSVIYTSSESIVEVAHVLTEKENHRLDPRIEQAIDAMWADTEVIKILDNGTHIARPARDLIREAIPQGWVLKPKDAIHLASAQWLDQIVNKVDEFHTYDDGLTKYQTMIGIKIMIPYVLQSRFD